MSDDLDSFEPVAKMVVIGVGGAGNNAVNRMIDDEIQNVEFYVANTDKQALSTSKAPNRIVLGESVTKGLGAGGDPKVGREAAEASADKIREICSDADMVFIAAGMGGGTGTGAAPVIASIARECGALSVAIVTRPFGLEGEKRIAQSVEGLSNLMDAADAIIVVSNDNLLRTAGNTPISEAFRTSDSVLAQSVRTVADLVLLPGLINSDFRDVGNILRGAGISLIGFGQGSGPKKAELAAETALNNPLLEAKITGARSAICAVTCGNGVTLYEAQDCVNRVKQMAGGELDIKFAVSINSQLDDTMLVSVIASRFENGGRDLLRPIEPGLAPASDIQKEEPDMPSQPSGADDIVESILPNFLFDD